MIFQDPMTYLNPVIPVGNQITESLILHQQLSKSTATEQVIDLLQRVGIPEPKKRFGQYPHQLSGGMRQRVMIAMALACNPKILIADEPTTALDVTIQAQITDLVKKLRDQFGMSIIWITHDLGIIAGLADRVIVMYAGFIVEIASVQELYEKPCHPYTLGLLESLPRLDLVDKKRLRTIQGLPPVLNMEPIGCPFAPRCAYAFNLCSQNPKLRVIDNEHSAACWWNLAEGRTWDG
jgi:oligopeptide transport system ATP-binding protein